MPAYHMNGKVTISFLLIVHLCGYLCICLKNVMCCAITFYIQKNTRKPLICTTGRLHSPPAFGNQIIVVVVKVDCRNLFENAYGPSCIGRGRFAHTYPEDPSNKVCLLSSVYLDFSKCMNLKAQALWQSNMLKGGTN